jgi:hypothetical protein
MRGEQHLSDKVFVFNDHSTYNIRYRSDLIKSLSSRFLVDSVGWKDTSGRFIRGLLFGKSLGFSSNAKSNVLVLLFRFFPTVVLFNGLGRFRKYRLFRLLLNSLITWNRNNIIIFQNYLDYRFYRRYSKRAIFWIPGSGGVCRPYRDGNCYGTVTRADKLQLCRRALSSILSQDFLRDVGSFKIVGVESQNDFEIRRSKIAYVGYVPQDDLFKSFSTFVQLPGYGEGIPHSLVDAIVSNMRIVITKKQYIEFGFHKLGFQLAHLGGEWFELLCFDRSEKVSTDCITPQYVDAIERLKILSVSRG